MVVELGDPALLALAKGKLPSQNQRVEGRVKGAQDKVLVAGKNLAQAGKALMQEVPAAEQRARGAKEHFKRDDEFTKDLLGRAALEVATV